jgi:hypothetical protein
MTLSNFFFDTPIYKAIEIDSSNYETFKSITDSKTNEEFEGYNPRQKIESTFIVITDLQLYQNLYDKEGGFETVQIKCKRTDAIFHFYIVYDPSTKTLMKVGQYPSVADFHIYEIKQYTKLLPKEKLKEFARAIGLAANGIGIGSFVYLRRIFEHLIIEAYRKAKDEGVVSEADFQKARMDEKINLLHSYLPVFLVENKSIHSILSLGVHQLDEETCLTHFDTLRIGIELILDEKLDDIRKKEKIKLAKQKLDELKTHINK